MARAKLPPGIQEWTPHPETGRPRYLVRWRTPERKPRKRVFDRLAAAKAFLADVTSAKNRGTYIDASLGRQTFDDFAQEWAAAQDTWKAGTRDAWPSIRARLRPSIGAAPLASVDQLALKWLRAELAKKYAPATVKLTMAYAGMILRAAHASRRIGHDPTAGLRAKRARVGERTGQVGPEDVPTRAEARDQFYASGWRPALRGAGLAEDRFKFHACRHWCASTLLAGGAPITSVAGHLGDTVETVSRTYVHWLRDDRDVPAEVLDRVLAPPVAPQARHGVHEGGV
jgi:hypothetical protein